MDLKYFFVAHFTFISPVADIRFYYRKHVQTKCPFDSKIKLLHSRDSSYISGSNNLDIKYLVEFFTIEALCSCLFWKIPLILLKWNLTSNPRDSALSPQRRLTFSLRKAAPVCQFVHFMCCGTKRGVTVHIMSLTSVCCCCCFFNALPLVSTC